MRTSHLTILKMQFAGIDGEEKWRQSGGTESSRVEQKVTGWLLTL